MGSMVPFTDLNFIPDPIATTSSTAAATISPRIKIEPKLEPFETHESLISLQNPSLNISINSQATPDSISLSQGQELSSESNNVYSEFHRISEAFRSAFEKRMEGLDDVEDMDSNCQAIVTIPPENQVSTVVVTRRRINQRSAELVRVMDLGIQDQRHFRDVVRHTRMVYDSLRIFSMAEEEKREGPGPRRIRADLKAASLMMDRGLWLNRDKRIVGAIPGIYIGDLFLYRIELCVVGLHGQAQAGIDSVPASQSANGEPVATSIIISGGYEDDVDGGEELIYTGQGGQDKVGKQISHQKLEGGNLALERSMHYGLEVRVIRGIKHQGGVSEKVYFYDGLYKVVDSWFDIGISGFGVYKFKLVRNEGQPAMGSTILKFAQNLLRSNPLTVRPIGYISLDMSSQKENVPILVFNDLDDDREPLYYEYLKQTVFPPSTFNNQRNGGGIGCQCVSRCTNNCACALRNGGEFAYDNNGLLVRGKPLIFECGTFCRCPPNCRNRVSQYGIRNRLEVFRSQETGWGVRSLEVIQAGAFICEYAAVFLTRDQASVFTMNGDSLIYPNRFAERWAEWGDFSKIFSDFAKPLYPSIPPLDFAMDVSKMRNVACYISHSTSPNVLVQFVLYDHNNTLFPHIMLYALENIPPMRELSIDYGVADEWSGKLICN